MNEPPFYQQSSEIAIVRIVFTGADAANVPFTPVQEANVPENAQARDLEVYNDLNPDIS